MLDLPLAWADRVDIEPYYRFFGFKLLPACAILAGLLYVYAALTGPRATCGDSLEGEWLGYASPRDRNNRMLLAGLWFIACGIGVLIVFWDFN